LRPFLCLLPFSREIQRSRWPRKLREDGKEGSFDIDFSEKDMTAWMYRRNIKALTNLLVKLINNQLAHATFLANCEAFTLGEKLGLSLEAMTEVFNHGTARSYSTEIRFPRYILPKSFNMGATFATVYKDLSLVGKLKNRAGLKLPITRNAHSYYKFAVKSGDEEEDFSKIFLKMKELSKK